MFWRGQRSSINHPRFHRPIVLRCRISDRVYWYVGLEQTVMENLESVTLDNFTDDDCIEIPLLEDVDNLFLPPALCDDQHPLLRFGQHHFVGGHSSFALRH